MALPDIHTVRTARMRKVVTPWKPHIAASHGPLPSAAFDGFYRRFHFHSDRCPVTQDSALVDGTVS